MCLIFFFFFLPLSCTYKSLGFLENTSCLLDGFMAVPAEPAFLSLDLTRGCWVCVITGASSPLTGGPFLKSFECENALPSWSANENVICCDNTGWYYVIFPGSISSKFLTRRLQDHEKPFQSTLNNICSLSSRYIFSSLFITRKEELDFCFRIPSSKFEPTKLSVTPLIFMSSLSLQPGLWKDWYVRGMVASFAITYA